MLHHTIKLITSNKKNELLSFQIWKATKISKSPPLTQHTHTHSLTRGFGKHTDWGGTYITAHVCAHERHFLTELCLQAWEEQERGKSLSCTTCFPQARRDRRQLSGYFRKLFSDNHTKHSSLTETKQNINKNLAKIFSFLFFCWCSVTQPADSHINAASSFQNQTAHFRHDEDLKWKISEFSFNPTRCEHTKSTKYGHFPENTVHVEPEPANDIYPTSGDRQRVKEKEERERDILAAPSHKSPFQGPLFCLHTCAV